MTSNQTEADGGATDTSPDADEGDAPLGADATPPDSTDVTDVTGVTEDPDQGGEGDRGTSEAEELGDVPLGDDEDDGDGPSRMVLLVGAAVAFVAIAIVGILIASGGGDSGGGSDEEGAAPADARADVGIFGTIDQFDRPDSATSMGDFAPGRPWSADAGTCGIERGGADLVETSDLRNHPVINLDQGDGGAQVRLDKVVNGAGLVFRYVGPYNYWAVVAVPDVATWNIIKVVEGDQEVIGNTGQSPTADGSTVGVRLRGDTVDVIVNGRVRKTIVDDFQVDAGKVGITARGPDSGDARFDDFVAGLPGGVPLTGGAGNGGNGAGVSSTTTSTP